MNPGEKKEKGYYSSLKGLHRTVPIILIALALFIAICFISGNAGALGSGISSLLRGLFSVGAYAIPLLLVIHGIFYAEDIAKKRLISRIIFSVITVLVISTIEYTIAFFGKDFLFTPTEFYKEKTAGGLIGSAVAYGLVKMLGTVGVYILAAAIFAIYLTYFFSGKNTALGRVMYSILGFLVGILALIERGIKRLFGSARTAKENKKKRDNHKKNQELLDDQFFEVDNGIRELKINESGILGQPTVTEEPKDEPIPTPKEENIPREGERRSVNLDYGFTAPMASFAFTEEAPAKEEKAEPFIRTEQINKAYGLDASADSVFTQSFDPFDFATNEKLASKASSRAIRQESEAISEIERPLSAMSDEQIEAERKRMEFERRKKMIIEMRSRSLGIKDQPVATSSLSEKKPEEEELKVQTPVTKTVEFNVTNAPTEIKSNPTVGSSFRGTFEKQESRAQDDQKAAAEIAEMVAMSNPAYRRSSNEIYTYVKITENKEEAARPGVEELYTPESEETAISNIPEEEITTESSDQQEVVTEELSYNSEDITEEVTEESEEEVKDQFKPYAPFEEEEEKSEPLPEQTITLERTVISPTPAAISARDEKYTLLQDDMDVLSEESEENSEESEYSFSFEEAPVENEPTSPAASLDEGTVFSFGDEDEEAVEETEEEYDELPEDEAIISEEIPPEKQNPEVISQRAMFPFLDREEEEEEEEEDAVEEIEEESFEEDIPEEIMEEEEEEDDEPPFEMDEIKPSVAPAIALVPAKETKKESTQKKPDYSNYEFPPIDLLGKDEKSVDENVDDEIQENADKLIETLASFNVTASIKGVDRGPRITRYEVVPARGVKVSSVMNLQDDIALGLAAEGIRMEAPIPGKSAIGVEIPNIKEETVRLRELLETEDFVNAKSKTAICIGKDVTGQPVINDIAKMPHLLIAGATGMGKSVCINSLMISMLYKARPDEVKFIMIDPKQVEFTMYNGIPHLLVPVVSDAKQAAGALMWAVEEMERRYNLLNTQYVRNVDAYNEKVKENPSIGEPMSRIVIVIDEFADLMLQVRDPVEQLVMRIAQKARAAGIHLIIGTQRPAVNVITGTIKANVPSRISCKVASNTDSRTVLDAGGAEKLLNKGDMLFSFAGAIKPLRVQGAFVKDSEVESIMKYLKQFSDGQSYDQSVMEEIERAAQKCSKKGADDRDDDDDDDSSGEGYLNDRQFLDAVELAVNSGRIATSLIQRKLSIGYGKAAKFIDIMEDMGIVGPGNGPKPRDVLIGPDEWREKLARSMID